MTKVQEIAARYRESAHGDEATCGYVLVYAGRVCGWKREVTAPETVCPGVVAVDPIGQMFEASGGDDYNGALHWVESAKAS